MIEVVVCSKDRPKKLFDILSQIDRLVPVDNVLVYEGSDNPNKELHIRLTERFGVKFVYVPKLGLGAIRARIMEDLKADYVVIIDDDLRLKSDWLTSLMACFSDSDVVVASSKIILDDPLLSKLSWAHSLTFGDSGGATIYDRKAVLNLGNFNKNIHRGEDTELVLRVNAAGKKWIRCHNTWAYHPATVLGFLNRPKIDVLGWKFIMDNSEQRVDFMVKRFGSTFIMPIYYFWKTMDLRCAGIWFVFKMKSLLLFLLS